MNFKKRNRWYGLLLSFVLLFSLGGCGDVQTENPQPSIETSVTDTTQEASDAEAITDELDQSELQDQDDTAQSSDATQVSDAEQVSSTSASLDAIPAYEGYAFVEINNNQPFFTDADKQRTDAFEDYSELDSLGRCGVAYANICKELQPTEPRGKIGMVKPSGWHTVKYNDIIDGNYLYNRCHLIGFQLAGENANPKNLITGTRYLNVVGMLPFENAVDDYVDTTGNHVLYRVTPMFSGDELVARGVLMEAYSVEDLGAGIQFCYYVYNIQPGIGIDYQTGDSWEDASVVAKDNTTYRVTGTANVQAQEEQTEATETVTPQPAQQEVESAPPAHE
ncbi:MAG: DNA/RNA non-specific endonuclease [Eubacterium sp.]|nr:DNA/RNA non-specific endonuclease [Eubacterium sp.]